MKSSIIIKKLQKSSLLNLKLFPYENNKMNPETTGDFWNLAIQCVIGINPFKPGVCESNKNPEEGAKRHPLQIIKLIMKSIKTKITWEKSGPYFKIERDIYIWKFRDNKIWKWH